MVIPSRHEPTHRPMSGDSQPPRREGPGRATSRRVGDPDVVSCAIVTHVRRGARSHRRIFGSRPPREARCGRHLRRNGGPPAVQRCRTARPLERRGRLRSRTRPSPSRSIRSWRRTLNQVAWVVQPAVRLYAFRIARHAAVAIRSSRDENRALSDLSEKLSQHAATRATRARWSARPFRDPRRPGGRS